MKIASLGHVTNINAFISTFISLVTIKIKTNRHWPQLTGDDAITTRSHDKQYYIYDSVGIITSKLDKRMDQDTACIYLLQVNNKNTRTRCETCSKLKIKTPERRQKRRSGVFIVDFEDISHVVLEFLLLTLNM